MAVIREELAGALGALAVAARCQLMPGSGSDLSEEDLCAAHEALEPLLAATFMSFHALAVGTAGTAMLMLIGELRRRGRLQIEEPEIIELIQRLPLQVIEEGAFDMEVIKKGDRH